MSYRSEDGFDGFARGRMKMNGRVGPNFLPLIRFPGCLSAACYVVSSVGFPVDLMGSCVASM